MTLEFMAVVPARYASTRLPGKPLADIGGKPMVVCVAEQAARSGASQVIVAADHELVAEAAKAHGIAVCMTSPDCASGTDRLAQVAQLLAWPDDAVVVNVQGDEPLIEPELIRATALLLHDKPDSVMTTVCHPLRDIHEVMNPNVVKLVMDKLGHALYFSRAPIPWARDEWAASVNGGQIGGEAGDVPRTLPVYRHVGLYAYRVGFLKTYPNLERPALESFESLEQLRALWHGFKISVHVTDRPSPPGVDTPEDLERVRHLLVGV